MPRLSRNIVVLLVAVAILMASTATLGVLLLTARPPTPGRTVAVQVDGVVDSSNVTGLFWFQFSIGRFANLSQPGSGGTLISVFTRNVSNGSTPRPFALTTTLDAGKDYAFWVFVGTQVPTPLGVFPTAFLNLQTPASFTFRVWLAGSDWHIGVTRSPST